MVFVCACAHVYVVRLCGKVMYVTSDIVVVKKESQISCCEVKSYF